jgi:hypothetical protein
MTLTNGGYLGIGTTAPNYPLVVSSGGAAGIEISPSGGIASGGFIQSYNRSTSAYFAHTNYATSWYWNNGSTSLMTLDTSGNLGIGVSPSYKLDVNGVANFAANVGHRVGAALFFAGTGTSSGLNYLYTNTTAMAWRNAADSAELMRLDNSGNLLVGTTTNSGTLTVKGNQYNASSIRVLANGNVTLDVLNASGTEVGYIQVNGAGTGTVYATSSDQRLKENIADAVDAGAFIDAIQVRQFDWISSGTHEDYGLIAQELMLVRPDAVSHGQTEDSMKAVDYPKLVPMLVKEIQSLRVRLNALESK